MTIAPHSRSLLPMHALTRGKRSAVTCHLKCADACSQPVPNTSDNAYFADVASAALSRRAVLGGAGLGALALLVAPGATASPAAATGRGGAAHGRGLAFGAIAPVPAAVDALTVPAGYHWRPIIRWGDPILRGAPEFDAAHQTAAAQAGQFGYNNDYLDIISTNRDRGVTGGPHHRGTVRRERDRRAVLVANHEYTNEAIMFPPATDPAELAEQRRIAMAAHGMSVVEVRRREAGRPWEYDRRSRYNRRVTMSTPFTVTGPAAGSAAAAHRRRPDRPDRARHAQQLRRRHDAVGHRALRRGELQRLLPHPRHRPGRHPLRLPRRGDRARLGARGPALRRPHPRLRERAEPVRLDRRARPVRAGRAAAEAHRARPLQARGRQRHRRAVRPGHRVHGRRRAVRLPLQVRLHRHDAHRAAAGRTARTTRRCCPTARCTSRSSAATRPPAEIDGTGALPADGAFDGTGQWLPLLVDGVSQVPGFTAEEVAVHTRLAADAVGATKMDRCEDVEPSPTTGRVYVACTNNTDRGKAGKEGATEPNPRVANRDGHIVEITEAGDDPTATTFTWYLLLVCGDPAADRRRPTSPASRRTGSRRSPARTTSRSTRPGNLWISTDGQPGTHRLLRRPVQGAARGAPSAATCSSSSRCPPRPRPAAR